MDHPGVKSLLDRIIRQQKPQPKTASENEKEIQLKKFTELDQPTSTSTTSFTRLTDFKDNLKQRMKARRCQIRKEEEEDNQMDEEYHVIAKQDNDDVITTNSKETKTISDDDEDEEDEDEDANESVDSDSNFKLNLNDDDDETEEKKSKNKKTSNKLSCYDFDEDDDELPDLTAKKRDKEIPLTNSIPSNQLTKDNVLNCNYNEFNLLSQDDPDRIFLEGTQFLVANKQRRSLDELTNISFNYETASNHTNTNTNHHTPNTTTTSTNQNSTGKSSNKSSDNTLNDEVLFDELAMLCSGQFRQTTQKNKLPETQPETKEKESITNNDLYEADDGDDYDNVMRNKVLFNDEDSSSSLSNNSVPVSKQPIEPESSPEEVIKPVKETKKKTIEDEELDENKEENLEDILGNDENSNDTKVKEKRSEDNEDNEDSEKEGFFEEEAELSGSEEEDEDYDGNSEDDKGLIFSGDEDELPSDSELKQQLGKFLLKDQMDEDKRQIRMFKEMYLADGEMHAKESRRKQFRWKNIDETWNKNNNRSSSEEDEEEEEEQEDDSEENKKEKKKKTEEREKKYAKLIANRNWRLNRHEREQFVHQKLKTNGLLSDEETEKNEYDESDDYSDDDENTKMSTLSTISSSNNQILKKGQQLLKQSLLNKSEQNKRTLNGEINNVNRPITIQPDKTQPETKQEEKVDLFKKFSFLNRDKSYLNRLSNYVNKNFTGNQGQHMSIGNAGGDFTGIVKPMTNKSRANNMIFSTVDNPALLNDPKTNRNKSEDQQQQKQTNPASNSSSPVVISSMPKRTKYDTCESIFNHIS